MKLQKNGATYQLSLPSALIRAKGWCKGDQLKALIDKNGNIVLMKD